MTEAERMAVDANIVAGMLHSERSAGEERAAIVAALRRWAEEGGDPWMSYCADRIEEGAHTAPVGIDGVPENSCRRCVHFRPAASWTCPEDALVWSETWVYDATDTEPKPGAPRCPGMKEK